MADPLLRTKLFIPPLRPNLIPRSRLINHLNQGLFLGQRLTLISAPAGFGKTTLASSWLAASSRPAAWLSLDDGDSDPARFLTYVIAALQGILSSTNAAADSEQGFGEAILSVLQSPQPLLIETVLTSLLNEISAVTQPFLLVLDDYHLVDAKPIDQALTYLLDHLPPQMHLAILTRVDPDLPLARYRARSQLNELRAAELRFTLEETAVFLNQTMNLNLSVANINALEARTEGWIAGLQLAVVSMRGSADPSASIEAFSGSHHFVLDYLISEVLGQQPQLVQDFLLQTAVLDRLSGSLCDALTGQNNGQATLEKLDHANLFVIPLDSERRWYRYHHLFADLLQRRLQQSAADAGVNELHRRASQWYEDAGLEIESFQHAAAAHDLDRWDLAQGQPFRGPFWPGAFKAKTKNFGGRHRRKGRSSRPRRHPVPARR